MRVPENSPGLCAVCFDHKFNVPYVDFEVFYDGPIVMLEFNNELAQRPIDDLFICKPCLVQAGALVGLGDVEKAEGELKELREEVARLRSERTDAVKRLDAVHTAVEGRQTLKKPVVKKPAAKKVAA